MGVARRMQRENAAVAAGKSISRQAKRFLSVWVARFPESAQASEQAVELQCGGCPASLRPAASCLSLFFS